MVQQLIRQLLKRWLHVVPKPYLPIWFYFLKHCQWLFQRDFFRLNDTFQHYVYGCVAQSLFWYFLCEFLRYLYIKEHRLWCSTFFYILQERLLFLENLVRTILLVRLRLLVREKILLTFLFSIKIQVLRFKKVKNGVN